MEKLFKSIIILLFVEIITANDPVCGQSAIGQLEKMTGQTISKSAASSASMNNMVGGMLMQGMLNAIFSTPTVSKAELEAKQKADELAARQAAEQAAEQQRIKDAEEQAEHDKMMQSFKQLDGSDDLKMKSLDNNNENTGIFSERKAIPLMRSQTEANVEEYFRTHFSPVSSNNELDESNFKYEPVPFYTKALLQQEQHLIITGTGLLVKAVSGGTLSTVVSWGSPILEEGILKPLEDCISGNCPTKGKIFENVLNGSESNIKAPIGEKISEVWGSGAAKLVGADASKFSKIGGKTFGTIFDAVDTGKDLYDSGIKEMWGSISGKDASIAIQKTNLMKNKTF